MRPYKLLIVTVNLGMALALTGCSQNGTATTGAALQAAGGVVSGMLPGVGAGLNAAGGIVSQSAGTVGAPNGGLPLAPTATTAPAAPTTLQAGTATATTPLSASTSSGGEVIMLTATWCHFCQEMHATAVPQAKAQYPNLTFREIDVDAQPTDAKAIGYGGLPTFVFRKNGTEVSRFEGANVAQLNQNCASLASAGPS